MSRNRSRNAMQNTFKDYLVPIVGWVILIILLFSVFWGDDTQTSTNTETSENINPVSVNFSTEGTQAFIMYPWDERKEIQQWASLYKWESVIVKEWIVNLTFENNNSISLNKVAELKYNEDASLSLYSSDAWVTLAENTKIAMRYVNIESPAGSILSLTQNEASSTIYVLDWSAKITNLWWAATSMVSWQKLSIARQYAADWEADLAWEKWNIDSYFKSSDWFIENDGISVLNKASSEEQKENNESTDLSSTGSLQWEVWVFLSFDSIRDEWNIDAASIDITGKVLSESVELVTINGKQAEISADKTFVVTQVSTNQSVNDIVVKIYDDNRAVLDKNVITLYNWNPSTNTNTPNQNSWSETSTSQTTSDTNSQGVTTFWVDATNFVFTQPAASGKFSTTGSEVTIRGLTTAENISKVEVNGFKLASFNGSTWRYHAFERFETLESGTNQYRVDYYWENGSIVYTDYYTIVKRDEEAQTQTTPEPEQESEESEDTTIPPEEDLFQ